MALITSVGTIKKMYTRKDDELIVKLNGEKKTVAEIAEATGRSPASIQYRIGRVLSKAESFDDISYTRKKKTPKATKK